MLLTSRGMLHVPSGNDTRLGTRLGVALPGLMAMTEHRTVAGVAHNTFMDCSAEGSSMALLALLFGPEDRYTSAQAITGHTPYVIIVQME